MFWIICAALTLAVGVFIMRPVVRLGNKAAEPAAAFDLRVYRDQLHEIERDMRRGIVAPDEAARLRTEVGRKVLDADRRIAEGPGAGSGGRGILAGGVLALLLAAGVVLYLQEGQPGRGDLPIAQRLADSQAMYANRPSQAEAEAAAPPGEVSESPEEFRALVQQLRDAVAANPDDPRGLQLLATNEIRLGNMAAARVAQQRLVDLRGDEASAEDLVRLSALMVEAAGGLITPEAEAILARALGRDPGNAQGRYLLGVLQLQNDRPDRAFALWRGLLEEGPESAPWIPPIRAAIADLAWLAGQPDYVPPAPPPMPDAEALAAAEGMMPEEQQQMIAGMVGQLEARLARQGGSPEEWARLIRSLGLIGQAEHAHEIWTEAQTRFASAPDALAIVGEAAESAGLSR